MAQVVERTLRINTPRVFAPMLRPSRYKGLYGGRGGAKSHQFAELMLEHHLEPGMRSVCVREVQRSLEQSVKRLLEDKIKVFDVGSKFYVEHNKIKTPGDGVIIFEGMQNHTAESIKSLEGFNRCWVEEARSLSARSLDLLRPTIRRPGSELWFSWNPLHPEDPVDELFRGSHGPPPDSIVVNSNFYDNPFFPDVLRREMEWDRSRDQEKYEHIWEGAYERNSEARVFRNWKEEEFDTPSDTYLYYGADWGYSIDPSVMVRCFIQGRKLYIDREVYQIGCEIDHLPSLFDRMPGSRDWQSIADSSRPETISYLNRNGFDKMVAAKKGPDSIKEGILFLQSYDIVVHPRCKHTIDELKSYAFKRDPLTNEVTPILVDKKNHVIDSLRYALENVRNAPQEGFVSW